MDPLTHGVASFALQRAFFPKVRLVIVLGMILSGLLADLDWFSYLFGPSTYLAWHRTATHSLLGALVLSVIAAVLPSLLLITLGLARWGGVVIPFGRGTDARPGEDPQVAVRRDLKNAASALLLATLASAVLHVMMDLCQSDGVALLWPFSSRRIALDLLPTIEPWLLTILIAAIAFPELFRLVSDEIGARSKRPRGRNGAMVGLALAALYIGLRALSHANTVAALEAHTIAGETPHRAAAFPDSTSPFHWHGVVETESALNLVVMRSMGGEVSYASGVTTLHKPEPSPMLAAAQNSSAAVAFVRFARFPKATVQSELDGYSVEIQDLKDQTAEQKSRTVFADINLDKNFSVVSSELRWQKDASSSH